MNMSRMFRLKGDFHKALEVLDGVDRSIVDEVELEALYARIMVESGQTGSGEELLDKLLSENPENTEGLLARGLLDARSENWEEAEKWLRKAINSSPANPEIRLNLVRVLKEQGKIVQAEKEARDYLNQSPASMSGREILGSILIKQNRIDESADLFNGMYQENPEGIQAHERSDGGCET